MNSLDGYWKMDLSFQEEKLPFILEFKDQKVFLHNSNEVLDLGLYQKSKEGLIKINILNYENAFELKEYKNAISGFFIKKSKKEILKFKIQGKRVDTLTRFNFSSETYNSIGKWKLSFFDSKGRFLKNSLGIFRKEKGLIKGSILTETGDYRYLEGYEKNNKLFLFGFDGQFMFKIYGDISENRVHLKAYSGKSWSRTIKGVRDPFFSLKDPGTLTKTNKHTVDFLVNSILNDKKVSFKTLFNNRPMIIQIFGSWCPNCSDETVFLTENYKSISKKADIYAIGFEKSLNLKHAKKLVIKFKERFKSPYAFYVGSYDKDKKSVTDVFKFIKKHISYPTLIFINSRKEVYKIHTGFSGPATAKAYEEFKENFFKTLKGLK